MSNFDDQISNLLQSIGHTLHSTRRGSSDGSPQLHPGSEAAQLARLYGINLAGKKSPSPAGAAEAHEEAAEAEGSTSRKNSASSNQARVNSNYAGDALTAELMRDQLIQARDLIRRLDSERRHYAVSSERKGKDVEAMGQERVLMQQRASESHRRVLQLEGQLASAKHQLHEMDALLDYRNVELLNLKRFVRSLPPALVEGYHSISEGEESLQTVRGPLGLVPDRRFEEAFKDKMSVIGYKRRFRGAKLRHEQTSEQLEALQMEMEDGAFHTATDDPNNSNSGDNNNNHPNGSRRTSLKEEDGATRGRLGTTVTAVGGIVTAAALARAPTVLDFPIQLPFSPTTPQEAHVKSLIYKSKFAQPLMELKDTNQRNCTRLKTVQDAGLYRLRTIYMDTLRNFSPEERQVMLSTFDKNVDALMRTHRELLYSVVNQTVDHVRAVTNLEKKDREEGGKATRSVGCMAVDTSAEDYRVHRLQDEMQQHKLKSLETQSSLQKSADELRLKINENHVVIQSLFNNLRDITRAVTTVAQRQQGTQSGEVADPLVVAGLPALGKVDPEDQRLTAKLAEATQLDLMYLSHLGIALLGGEPTRRRESGGEGSGKPPKSKRSASNASRKSSLPALAERRSSLNQVSTSRDKKKKAANSSKTSSATGSGYGATRRHTVPEPPTTTADKAPRRHLSATMELLPNEVLLPEAAKTTGNFSIEAILGDADQSGTPIKKKKEPLVEPEEKTSAAVSPQERGSARKVVREQSPSNVMLNVVDLDFNTEVAK